MFRNRELFGKLLQNSGLSKFLILIFCLFTTLPATAAGVASVDSDGDGLTDYQEMFVYFTDPQNKDTDGDSLSDY